MRLSTWTQRGLSLPNRPILTLTLERVLPHLTYTRPRYSPLSTSNCLALLSRWDRVPIPGQLALQTPGHLQTAVLTSSEVICTGPPWTRKVPNLVLPAGDTLSLTNLYPVITKEYTGPLGFSLFNCTVNRYSNGSPFGDPSERDSISHSFCERADGDTA